MGANRSGANRRKRLKRKKKEQKRIDKKTQEKLQFLSESLESFGDFIVSRDLK